MEVSEGRRYKSRRQKPCDACRRRKICCIREAGDESCSLCRMKSETCRFESIPKPRKSGKASKTTLAESVANSRPKTAANQVASSSKRSRAGPRPKANGEDEDDHLPPTRPAKEWISFIVGSSSDHDPFVLRHVSYNDLNYYRRSDWACIRVGVNQDGGTHFTVVPDSYLDARPRYYPKEDVRQILQEEKMKLVQTYFETVHTSLPLLDPAAFEQGDGVGDLLLAVICEIASPFYLHKQSPNDMKVLDWIFQALPCEIRQPKLETVEASLLFLHRHARYHRAPPTPGLWSDIGSIIGMSQDIGLNVDPTTWDISKEDRDRRIRLWWLLYMHDKWSAMALGRPPYLNEENHNVPLPTLANFPTKNFQYLPSPDIGILQFVGMAVLTTILSDILATFYSLRSHERLKSCPPELLETFANQFLQRLIAFHNEHLLPLYDVDGFLDPTGTIFLAYHIVQMILYRAMLRHLDPTDVRYHQFRTNVRPVVDNVISLLQGLTIRRLRAFWWNQISNHNFAIAGGFMMSLLLTSIDDTEVDYWTARIKLYHDLLQNQSVSFITTKLASARMSLLLTANQNAEDLGEGIFTGTASTQAFCGDFRVELRDA